ncbi:MAG: DUF4407 domain-containing protein [Flammeovirgaceae bacterium]|jgi:hypothetical protein|nr:DUF4407 domain-containing protein [Flammeovirgaceae bacterium]|tara:strand:+ start:7592 stop:8758 length:1167 start_codon:yes stop_codon:yes gene_type:complete
MIDSERKYGPFLRFFLFCSAADVELLNKCPNSEVNKYAGVGATVFFTGILACASGGYALFTAFDSIFLSVILGIFWGSLVFNLDRFLVSTIKKSRGKFQEVVQITPRLLLAVLLSLVISVPLELKIFEQEIEESIYYAGAAKIDKLNQLYDGRVSLKQERIDGINASTLAKFEVREEYYRQYVCECDGTCGTGQKGRGTECERKENKYLQSQKEYDQAVIENAAEIQLLNEEKQRLLEEYQLEKDGLLVSFADGLLVRLEALRILPFGPQLAIILLLISIEIAPILVKLLSPYGPYDHLLKTIEYDFEIDEITAVNMRNQQLNNKLTIMASIEQDKVEQELKNNEGAMRLIGDAHLEIVKAQLEVWVDDEKDKIRKEVQARMAKLDES